MGDFVKANTSALLPQICPNSAIERVRSVLAPQLRRRALSRRPATYAAALSAAQSVRFDAIECTPIVLCKAGDASAYVGPLAPVLQTLTYIF